MRSTQATPAGLRRCSSRASRWSTSGAATPTRTAPEPWERDTIVNVFSVTKTMTALCALILVDRGLSDPDAPVARYWPEFAAAGKERVLVRHVLAHTAGLPDWEGPVAELYDWPRRPTGSRRALRSGSREPRSAITRSPRASWSASWSAGSPAAASGDFFAAEVAGPLDADFWIRLPAEHEHRVALGDPSRRSWARTMPPVPRPKAPRRPEGPR